MFSVVSTRFNNDTWSENQENRRRRNVQCLYGSPQEMSPKIDYNSTVFVVEMNNSVNEITGIGLIKNTPRLQKYYNIHSDGNFNRYAYFGKYHITRNLLMEYNEPLVFALDHILFKEKTHLKRGAGFTTIPEKLMNHKVCQGINIKKEIKDIFLSHFLTQPEARQIDTNITEIIA